MSEILEEKEEFEEIVDNNEEEVTNPDEQEATILPYPFPIEDEIAQ